MNNLKSMSLLKKMPFILLIIAVIAFFAIPSFIFADEGDVDKFIGIDGASAGSAGQYVMGDTGGTLTDPDGTTEVFCIDSAHTVGYGETGFAFTGDTVSEEIIADQGIGETVDAYAAEILSKEATGATSVEDQCAMWILTNNVYHVTPDETSGEDINDKEDIDAIDSAARALSTEYIAAKASDPTLTLDKFLEDMKNINEIDVTIEQTSDIFTGDAGIATAIMAEPFVPTITDQDKNVYWYILEGSFNISFSPTELLLNAFSGDTGSDASQMTDSTDTVADIDKDSKPGGTDHYGKSTVSYFYFPWLDIDNNQLYPLNTMGINIFAWADIDDDSKYDLVDSNPSDGNVLSNYEVVKTELKTEGLITKSVIDTDTSGNIETEALSTIVAEDIHKVEGGLVIEKTSNPEGVQNFSTISYTEPYDDDPQFFGTLIFKYTGVETGLSGAQFGIFKNSGDTVPLSIITSDLNGFASTDNSGLAYGTYYVKEIVPPSGYDLNTTVYTLIIGGNGVGIGSENGIVESAPFGVINTPTPPVVSPPTTPPTVTTPGGTVTVAALTEGIQVLAFTGQDPIITIAGLAAIMAGLAMVIVALSRKYTLKLQNAKK